MRRLEAYCRTLTTTFRSTGIEGNNPARFFVDDPSTPHTALVLTVEGYYLLGDDDNRETNAAIHCFFSEKVFNGEVFIDDDSEMELAISRKSWEGKLAELIPTHEMMRLPLRHNTCQAVTMDWRGCVPEGYEVLRVDQALLNDEHVVFPRICCRVVRS